MRDRRTGPSGPDKPIPKDMEDQQAGSGEDPWEPSGIEELNEQGDEAGPDPDLPETDEAGSGRRGERPHSGSPHPEHPAPEESSG